MNRHVTSEQTQSFYVTLKTLVLEGDVCFEHPLRHCPSDPFSRGSSSAEAAEAQQLHALLGNWARDLRRLYFGYSQSGYRAQNLHTGIAYLTLEDEELRHLLRSHPEDPELFPWVFCPEEVDEAHFRETLMLLDSRTRGSADV